MKISFDGMRITATASMNALHETIFEIIEDDDICSGIKEDLIKRFNDAAMDVNFFNCLYDNEVEDDFNEMDDLSIKRFENMEVD